VTGRGAGRAGVADRPPQSILGSGVLVVIDDIRSDTEHPTGEGTVALLTCLANDLDEGFADLVRSEERVVYSVALRMTRSSFEAEDLTAETFLRAYRALRGYDRNRVLTLRPRSWLLTIALNTWRNAVREASRRPTLLPSADLPDTLADGHDVERAVEGAETRRELGRLVAQLPVAQRVAVVLRHVVGLPMVEVAAVLDCPEGTAKSHVSRGLRKLRTLYDTVPLSSGAALAGRREQR
jgi:RNA polymerase sigma factor (sigma-70 family)